MRPEELSSVNLSDIDAESINYLDTGRQKIEQIIKKYLSKDERFLTLWDLPEEISKDIKAISTWIMFMAPRIGYLEGLVVVAEEEKKLAKARATLDARGTDVHTGKPKAAVVCEDEGRVAVADQIRTYAKITASSASFKAFHFQANRFIETLTNRLKTLKSERINYGETNE